MKNHLIIFFICLLIFSCNSPNESDEKTVTDIDGNTYHTIKIGEQVWLKENLKTTKYRNGDPIPNITEDTIWSLRENAYCNYNNNPENGVKYGRLYNLYSVIDSRKISPQGWHVATDEEWTTLINYLGGQNVAGGKLREKGFESVKGGQRLSNGSFVHIDTYSMWWCSNTENQDTLWMRYLAYNSAIRYPSSDLSGYSVRCVQD